MNGIRKSATLSLRVSKNNPKLYEKCNLARERLKANRVRWIHVHSRLSCDILDIR